MASTEPEQASNLPQPPTLAELAAEHDTHEAALSALASAQEELTELKDARREERMGWIVVTVILFDCFFLLNAENAVAPLVVGTLQIGILIVVARRLGVEEFAAMFSKIFERLGKAIGGGD